MRKITYYLALAAIALPSVIHAAEGEQRFTRDGKTYVYTVQSTGNGRQVIDGRRLPGGSAFHLVVSGTHVDGVSGGQPVSFRTPRTTPAPLAIAAR